MTKEVGINERRFPTTLFKRKFWSALRVDPVAAQSE